LAGTGASGVSGHRGSPRRALQASLATSTRHGEPGPHSHSDFPIGPAPRASTMKGRPRTASWRHGMECPKGEDLRSGASAQLTARSRRETPLQKNRKRSMYIPIGYTRRWRP
jgi:hypothetical protein